MREYIMKKETKSFPCTHCGWAMGEKEGEPLCNHCKKKNLKGKT